MFTNIKNNINPTVKKYIKIFIASFFISIATRFFVIYAGIYSSGAAGLSQGITYTMFNLQNAGGILWGMDETTFKNSIYWIVYAIINIPIVLWSITKFGKKFIMMSIFAFSVSLSFSMIWTHVPLFHDAGFIPGYDKNKATPEVVFVISTISAFLGALIGGVSLGVIFNQGASTIGADPITRYVSREKGMSVASFMFTISIVNIFMWETITFSISSSSTGISGYVEEVIFSATMLASIIYIAVYSLSTGLVHPVSKVLNVKITTTKAKSIVDHLNKDVNFHRGQTIYDAIGGYTKQAKKTIEIILNSEEYTDLVKYVREVDEAAFISSTRVEKIKSANGGKVTWTPKTKSEIERAKRLKAKKEIKEIKLKNLKKKPTVKNTANTNKK